ncbi:MAG: LptA/OstA family protein [Candidatus Gastranaerophilales bacterium]|nr:LptA/OstA family protein [Candidatus Gastranaerophilales bacterium]
MNKKYIIISFLLMLFGILNTCLCLAENLIIEADKQNFDAKDNLTHFEGNVKATSNDITVKGPKAVMKINSNNKPEYALFLDNPVATKVTPTSKSKLKANIMRLSLIDNIVKAEGNAFSEISGKVSPSISMKSDSQEFNISTNTIFAKGNVEIIYKDLKTKSNEAIILVNKAGKPQRVNLIGSARLVQGNNVVDADSFIYNPVTEEISAHGNAHSQTVLDDLTQVSVWSDVQEYDKNTKTLMSSGNVKIAYKEYLAFGPKATLFKESNSSKPNKIIFLGRSRIRENSREVEANKIIITLNPKDFNAEGNVKTKFTQVQSYKKETKNKKHNNKSNKIKNRKKSLEEQEFRKKYPVIEKPVEYEQTNIFN